MFRFKDWNFLFSNGLFTLDRIAFLSVLRLPHLGMRAKLLSEFFHWVIILHKHLSKARVGRITARQMGQCHYYTMAGQAKHPIITNTLATHKHHSYDKDTNPHDSS